MIGLHGLEGRPGIRHTAHAGRRTKIERHILHIQLLVDASVLLHHEGVVARGDKQHVEDAPLHQLVECRIFQIHPAQGLFVHAYSALFIMQRYEIFLTFWQLCRGFFVNLHNNYCQLHYNKA